MRTGTRGSGLCRGSEGGVARRDGATHLDHEPIFIGFKLEGFSRLWVEKTSVLKIPFEALKRQERSIFAVCASALLLQFRERWQQLVERNVVGVAAINFLAGVTEAHVRSSSSGV
jgi:hypothetical protein